MARCENNIAAGAILNQLSNPKQDGCPRIDISIQVLINAAQSLFSFVIIVCQYLAAKFFFIILAVILILIAYLLYKCYWKPLLYTKEGRGGKHTKQTKRYKIVEIEARSLHFLISLITSAWLARIPVPDAAEPVFGLRPICERCVATQDVTDIGYDHITPGKNRQVQITRAQQARRVGSKVPPPYPNGWFAVADADELKVGGVLAVNALGQNLCVYRGSDGIARCVDTYCPHLGANIAVGGTVRGNCIECPFHKWTFGENGACVSVPGTEQAPRGVSIKTWATVEADGAVWVWHDAEGRAPLWGMADLPHAGDWGYRGRNEFMVSAHIQEIPENGADIAHLNAVHSPSLLSTLGEKYPILLNLIGTHVWSANWTKGDDHTASLTLTHDYKILKFNLFHIDAEVTQNGPGHVRLLLRTSLGPLLVSQSVTPLAPMLQRVVHRVYSPWYDALVGSIMVMTEAYMFERDVAIWNNKIFVGAPAYVKTDKTIRAFRSWFSQFYSENSKSFREAIQNPIDW